MMEMGPWELVTEEWEMPDSTRCCAHPPARHCIKLSALFLSRFIVQMIRYQSVKFRRENSVLPKSNAKC